MVECVIVTGYGINADRELGFAFEKAGARVVFLHVNDLLEEPGRLKTARILAFPGGFSFGDHLGSGLVLAGLLKHTLADQLQEFLHRGGLILGICNGFQVLVKMGILPNMSGRFCQEVSLLHNDSGVFENSWVSVAFEPECRCVWTQGLVSMDLPIRHGEGKFYTPSPDVLRELEDRYLVALRYTGRNPNGSQGNIAGITDTTGRVLGLMPHPEAFVHPQQHPLWHRVKPASGEGLRVIANGVAWSEQQGG